MNKYVWMGIGAAIGGGIGFVLGRVIADFIEAREDEINSDLIEEAPDFASREQMLKEKLEEFAEKHQKTDYTGFFKSEKPDPTELANALIGVDPGAEEGEDETVTVPEPDEGNPDIYLISEELFDANVDKFQIAYLNYFATDDVLAMPSGVPIADRELIVGDATLWMDFNPDGIQYICNERLHCLYKVTRVNEKFYKERDVRTKRRKPVKSEDE